MDSGARPPVAWAEPMASAVSLRAAVALTGRFPVLAGIDLTVAPGEVLVLEGANGAGKTSVLRACAGLLPVSSGEAVVLGHDLAGEGRRMTRMVGSYGLAVDTPGPQNAEECWQPTKVVAGSGSCRRVINK